MSLGVSNWSCHRSGGMPKELNAACRRISKWCWPGRRCRLGNLHAQIPDVITGPCYRPWSVIKGKPYMFSMNFLDNFSLSLVLSLSLSCARARARALSLSLRPSLRRTGAHTRSHILHPIITRARDNPCPPMSHGRFQEIACKHAINGTEEFRYCKHDCCMQHTRHHLVPHSCPQRLAHTPASNTHE